MNDFVAIDIETSGLNPKIDTVIKVMATKVIGGKIGDRFSTYVYTLKKLSPQVIKITGITNEDLKEAPTLDEVMMLFEEFREDLPIVAYNADFDKKFLGEYIKFANVIDLCIPAKNILGDKVKSTLSSIANHFDISDDYKDDSELMAKIYLQLN